MYINALVAGIEHVTSMLGKCSAALTLILVATLVVEVLSRYLFGVSIYWVYELSYMLMASIFMLALGYALKIRQHVNVDFLYNSMNPRFRAGMDIVLFTCFSVVLLWICKGILENVIQSYESNRLTGLSSWSPVVWPFRAVWLIGLTGLLLQVIAEILRNIQYLRGDIE